MPSRLACIILASSALLAACASGARRIGSTETTSAALLTGYRESEAAADDLRRGRYLEALALADHAVELSPHNAWARYDRATALHHLGRIDAAVSAFREAEARFGNGDRWGKSISIYGRARALTDVGRCEEAKATYAEYAAFVRPFDPPAAAMAEAYAGECRAAVPVIGDLAMTKVVDAVMTHHYADAIILADQVNEPARASGWPDYNRAVALAALGRTNDALEAYRSAERKLYGDLHGRAIAIYGQARALDTASRCDEARRAYEAYAALVRSTDPHEADMALTIAHGCSGP